MGGNNRRMKHYIDKVRQIWDKAPQPVRYTLVFFLGILICSMT